MSELLTAKVMKIPFVVASKWASCHTEWFDELVSVGNSILMKAAENYDPHRVGQGGKTAKFSTYAYKCVHMKLASWVAQQKELTTRTVSLSGKECREHCWSVIDAKIDSQWLMASLNERDRKLADMLFNQGMSPRQIARTTKEYGSYANVYKKTNSLIRRLREQLGVDDDSHRLDNYRGS